MILPLCMQKSHSHCCQTRSPKLWKLKWFTASAPGLTQESLGVIVPASPAGEDQMHRMLAVFSRRGHSLPPSGPLPGQYRTSAQRTMWTGFAALGRSRLNSRKHNWTAPVELTAVQPSPWLYRESTAPLGKNAETEQSEKGPPQYSQRKSYKTHHTKQQTNSKGKQGEGGDGDKNAPPRTNP